jgi:hypothetical protein
MGGKSQNKPTISTYYAGIHFVLTHGPIDQIDQIFIDDRLAFTGPVTTSSNITIDKPELFGGETREGGIKGIVSIAMGEPTQVANSYLTNLLGPISAYRGFVSIILNDVLLGNNYYLKPWTFVATRIHKLKNGATQWNDTKAEVAPGLINAVHVIRECLTDTTWGYGYSAGDIDDISFTASALTCFNEGLGFAFLWDNDTQLPDFIDEVRDHINASLYLDRVDGKFHLNLIRKLSSTTGLLTLNDSNSGQISNFHRKSIGDLVSTYTITFLDNSNHKDNSITVHDLALLQRQRTPVNKTKVYSGIASIEVAQKIALQDLKQSSSPVFSFTIQCNRDAENLNVGDAFLVNRQDYITEILTMRVVNIDLGTAIKQSITIDCVQDIFQAADLVYTTPPASAWVNPISNPIDAQFRLLNEMPYYILATVKGDNFAQGVPTTDNFIVMAAVSPTNDSISAGLWTDSGAGFIKHGFLDFCFTGTINAAIDKLSTSITIANVIDIELLTINHFIQIDNELVGVTAIAGNTLTIIRGVLDTVPSDHVINSRVFGWHDFAETDEVTYLLTEVINVKVTPITPNGELLLTSATNNPITISGRLHLPYPPGNLKINGNSWPVSITTADLILTWASRNRLQQTAGLISYYTGNITSETGVTYSSELRRVDTSALLLSFSGETGLTRTLDTLTALAGTVVTITHVGTIATVTMTSAHGLINGRNVLISGATDSLYNGSFIISNVTSLTFDYTMIGTPAADAVGTLLAEASIYFGSVTLTIWSVTSNGASKFKVTHTFNLI